MSDELSLAALSQNNQIGTLSEIADRASEFAQNSKSENTIRAYRSDWTHFETWCKAHGKLSLPATPETVALYVTDLTTTHSTATITRRISSISTAHQIAGFESPTQSSQVRLVMAGIRRVKGMSQIGKTPVLVEDLRHMVAQLPENLLGVRDRAILLIGFSGAFRRSELVALNVEDISTTRDGLVVVIRRSKTDQEGRQRNLGIPYGSNLATCPVRALQDWLEKCGFAEGPLFRPVNRFGKVAASRLSAAAIGEIVKKYVSAVGLDACLFAGHSLRSGFATSAAQAGASERSIMNQTGHRSLVTLRRYIRDGSLFRDNAVAAIGL